MERLRSLAEQGAAAYSKGDLEAFVSDYADDVVLTTPHGRFEGRDAARAYWGPGMASLPGAEITIGRSCEDGDVYFGEWRLRGTNTEPIVMPDGSQIPPTGKSVDVQGMECIVFSGDRIVQHDLVWDTMAFLTQLGLVPAP